MMLKKKPPLLFTVGAAALLMGGGALAYWGLSRNSLTRGSTPPGVQFVPQDALMTLTVTTQESQWNKLRQFGTPETQQAFDNFLIEWRDRILTANGYQFKTDIKPWLGDQVTIAFLPKSGTSTEAEADQEGPISVIILPIADPVKAQALMAEPKDNNVRWVGREYKGVNLQTITTTTGETFESAVLGTDWLIIAKSAASMEQVIDIYKGAASVLDTPGYRQAIQRIDAAQTFAQVYINLPATGQALTGTQENLPLSQSQGIASSLSVEADGLNFVGTSWLSSDSELTYGDLSNGAGEMPRRLPDETLMMISSGNLKQFWDSISGPEAAVPFLPIKPENLKAGLLSTTGLNIDEDLMPWMEGEFTFGLLPPASSTLEGTESATGDEVSIDTGQLLLMVQVSDREAAAATWQKLDQAVKSRYRYQIDQTEIEGQPVTQWVSPFQGITMTHGWLEGNVAFFGVGSGIPDAIAPRPQPSLAETGLFQSLTDQAPAENNGHFFIDLEKINELQGSLPLPKFSSSNEAITSTIKALTVTAAIQDDRSILYDLSIKLAKGDRPGQLRRTEEE